MNLDSRKLRILMAKQNFNVSTLARAAGVSQAAINKWLNHGPQYPRLDTLGRVAKALDVDIYELVKEA